MCKVGTSFEFFFNGAGGVHSHRSFGRLIVRVGDNFPGVSLKRAFDQKKKPGFDEVFFQGRGGGSGRF